MRFWEIAAIVLLIAFGLHFYNSKVQEIDNELDSQLKNVEERVATDLKYCVDARNRGLNKAVIEYFDQELLAGIDYYQSIIKSLKDEGFEVNESYFYDVFVYCKEHSLEMP